MKSRPVTDSELIGKVLRKRREALGMSQEAFADSISVHRTYYSALERGEYNLTLGTLSKVCSGLSTTAWEVLKEAGV
jgi:transcriptional regulator with XRE-family HTH domain